jgi:hypothetical protein
VLALRPTSSSSALFPFSPEASNQASPLGNSLSLIPLGPFDRSAVRCSLYLAP